MVLYAVLYSSFSSASLLCFPLPEFIIISYYLFLLIMLITSCTISAGNVLLVKSIVFFYFKTSIEQVVAMSYLQ